MEEDYSKRIETYSLDDLCSALLGLDKERYPDRYVLIEERIRTLEASPGASGAAGNLEPIDLEFNERLSGFDSAMYPLGILFGVGYLAGEVAEIGDKALLDSVFTQPTIIILIAGYLYFLFCVYRLHVFLAAITGGAYPIKPSVATFKHLIPVYGIYWPRKWAREIFTVFKIKSGETKTLAKYGIMIGVGEVFMKIDSGIALIIIFVGLSRIAAAIAKEYKAQNLSMLKPTSQEIGRKLVLE